MPASPPGPIRPDLVTGGRRRFACECGEKLYEGWAGVYHAFAGHEVVVETERLGRWYYDHNPLMHKAIDALRLPGETREQLLRRVLTRIGALKERANG